MNLVTFAPFLFERCFGSDPFEISLFMTLKALAPMAAFYWSAFQADSAIASWKRATLYATFPFFLLPLYPTKVLFFLATLTHTLFYRVQQPLVIELLRRSTHFKNRTFLYSLISMLGYICSLPLAFLIPFLIDKWNIPWLFLFPFCACISLGGLFFQYKLSKEETEETKEETSRPSQGWLLLKERRDFFHFQVAFFCSGAGFFLCSGLIPHLLRNQAGISLETLFIASSGVRQLGQIAITPLIAKELNRFSVERLSLFLFVGVSLLLYVFTQNRGSIPFLFFTYFFYGAILGTSHLLWNLSAVYFAKQEDSRPFSLINLQMMAIRGAVFPLLGSYLCQFLELRSIFFLGGCLSFCGLLYGVTSRFFSRVLQS